MRFFLLGGYDLEMLTIKNLLDQYSELYYDHHLNWENATVSSYTDELGLFESYDKIFGIELRENIALPPNYIRIDHHNELEDQPSSLEQVIDILGVEMTRYHQLVAANDKGYIPAMKTLHASDDEINKIRCQDRAAQGVTEEDERLADESIAENLHKGNQLWIVKSLTPKFSPICDRLFPYKRLLIYTDSEWMFYGEGKSELVAQFTEDIRQKKVFHGGSENGYIGCVKEVYNQEEIEQKLELIRNRYGNK